MMRWRWSYLLLVCVLLVGASCADDSLDPEPNDKEAIGSDLSGGLDLPDPLESDGPLPAYQTQAEVDEAGKADALDVRGSYESIYGVTRAPSGRVRAMAEWEPSDGVLVAWQDGMDGFIVNLIGSLHRAAPVYVVTPDLSYSRSLENYFARVGFDTSRIHFFEYANDAFWTRDFGPITVELGDGTPAFVDMGYYWNRRRDDAVPTLLGSFFDVPVYRPPLSTEGGNFMTNGEGLCAVTEWMLEENPRYSSQSLANEMADYLGCSQLVILERMSGEGTGHIDMFAKFTGPNTVLVGEYDPRVDPTNAAILDRNAERLASLRLADGSRLRVVRIPMPDHYYDVYPSFTNSLLLNGTAFVPTYRNASHLEQAAVNAYLEALPDGYEVVLIDSTDVIQIGGAIHCTAMAFNVGRSHGSSSQPAPTTPPSTTERFATSPDAPIQDGQVTPSTIRVASDVSGWVDGSIEVAVDIRHSYVGDLLLTLEHEGRRVVLFDGSGPGQDLHQRFATDAFRDTSYAGDWILYVADRATRDEGRLESWSVAF